MGLSTPRRERCPRGGRALSCSAEDAAGAVASLRGQTSSTRALDMDGMPQLTDEELAFFAREGYVVKEAVMDPEDCARLRDRMWEHNPTTTLHRERPESWIGPLPEEDAGEIGMGANKWGGYRWQLRETGGEDLTMNALPRRCFAIAEQMLGKGGAEWPEGGEFGGRIAPGGRFISRRGQNCRGTYVTLPYGPDVERTPLREQPGIHFDSSLSDDSLSASRFLVIGLIDETPPRCGGFTLYPRSAHRFYELALQLRREGIRASSPEAAARTQELVAAIKVDTEPVDCYGPAGTCVFMHRATAHTVQENYSDVLRQSVLYDFDCSTSTVWRGEPVCGHEVRTPILDPVDGKEIPPRLYEDDYWRAQPPLPPSGAPTMWEMWDPSLQTAATAALAKEDPRDRMVSTADEFVQQWDSRRNFLFSPECPPIAAMKQFDFPPTEMIVDAMLALDTTVAIAARRRQQTEYAGRDHNQLERFRAMPRDEMIQKASFNLRSQDFAALDAPGGLLAGFEEAVLQPWRTFLWQNGFEWDRCYPILRVSSADSVTGYHMDSSNVLFWNVRGAKTFHGCQDPDRWVGPPQHPRPNQTPMSPALREPNDALSIRVGDGEFVWNHLLTPHWVDSHALTLNINLSIGGLRHRGRLCRYEHALYESKGEGYKNSMNQDLGSSAMLRAQARL